MQQKIVYNFVMDFWRFSYTFDTITTTVQQPQPPWDLDPNVSGTQDLETFKCSQLVHHLRPFFYIYLAYYTYVHVWLTCIHSKSEKVCRFYFSVWKSAEKCVNCNDNILRQKCVNQSTHRALKCECVPHTLKWHERSESKNMFRKTFLHTFWRCLFIFISSILQNW